jgi:hypothetical protein
MPPRLKAEAPSDTVTLQARTFCDFPIVGESYCRDALLRIAARRGGVPVHCNADLVFEPTNPYDPNAVAVLIDGLKVGYLSREHAAEYGRVLASLDCAGKTVRGLPALIAGTDFIGVKLGLVWPLATAPASDLTLDRTPARAPGATVAPARPATPQHRDAARAGYREYVASILTPDDELHAKLEAKGAEEIEILFTGFEDAARGKLERLAASKGMRVRTAVTKKLTLLCIGPNAGPTKIARARGVHAALIDETRFTSLLNQGW